MRVLLIHQAFSTEQDPGGTRHFELGQRLKNHGDQMVVVTSQISYVNGKRIRADRGGLFYRENDDGIKLLRSYTPSVLHKSFVWRTYAFVVFALTSVWAGLHAGPVDLVMGTTPPLFQAFSAWLIAFLSHKPFLLEIRDLWPEFAIDMGVLKNPLLIRLSRWGERFLYTSADQLLVNSPAYREYLLTKGVPVRKISFVANGVEISMFDPARRGEYIRQQYDLTDKFVVTYAGAHGQANDLGVILQAANQLRDQKNIHFLMVGDGKDRPRLEAEAMRLNLPNITFTGAVPKNHIPDVLGASDAGVAILMNIPMFTMTYPNKVFDYMAAGRPTILAIDGVIRDVIEAANGGIFVPPGDATALAQAVIRLSSNPETCLAMGLSARAYVQEHFNREQQADEFRGVLQDIIWRQHNGNV